MGPLLSTKPLWNYRPGQCQNLGHWQLHLHEGYFTVLLGHNQFLFSRFNKHAVLQLNLGGK